MASSSSAVPSSDFQTFNTMDKDLEAIGAHCQYTYCNQLDFLPFRCESCKNTFCLDHRTESAHKCGHAGEWAAARRKGTENTTSSGNGKPTLATATQCSHPQCKTHINTFSSVGVSCQICNRQYCLKHRLREDHSCATLTPLGARPATPVNTQAQKAQAALSRLRLWGKEKAAAAAASPYVRAPPKPSSAAAKAQALSNIRKNAKGDSKIPADKRVYLHVEAEATTTASKLPSGDFFYNKEWSVGRMLDEAARGLQVQNVNNRGGGEEEKLRVFHVEGGRLLEFGEKVGAGLGSGNTVVLLRGVGPAVPDLITA